MINIGGFQSFSTVDYPCKMSTVVYLQGCPWKCSYCYNGELIDPNETNTVHWETILELLHKRIGLVDAVVFSGGEPTLQDANLINTIDKVKDMGFEIGLHTSGVYPNRLKKVLPLIDWVGLDIKAAKKDYPIITKAKGSGDRAWKSLTHVLDSDVDYEIRTTLHPDILSHQMLEDLTDELNKAGVNNYVIQKVRQENCLDPIHRIVYNLINDDFLNKIGKEFRNFKIR